MAYEWVAPTATAAVGIAGVVFTWLSSQTNARTQQALLMAGQRHETERERRLERRETFAGVLVALAECNREIGDQGKVLFKIRGAIIRRLTESGGAISDEAIQAAASTEETVSVASSIAAILRAVDGFDRTAYDAQLSGSEAVTEAMDAVREDLLDICTDFSKFRDWRYLAHEKREALIAAMRADLGYEPDA
ncbi:hypothetical protein [Blastococcus sp. SYSU DS0539]